MSINLARILFTVLCFGSFLIVVLITYRKGAKKDYEEIARDVYEDDDTPHEDEQDEDQDSPTHGNGANK